MIYGQDEAMLFPTMDLYDTGVMNMYLTAARDLYQQGLKDYEDFVSKYGDFTSPIASDVDYWDRNTIGAVNDVYNDLLAAGIDPVRSQEGRAIMAKTVRNLPYAQLSAIRQSAKNADLFNKAKTELAAKGLYNPDLSKYEGGLPEEYSTIGDDGRINIWNTMSPTPYQDLSVFTKNYFGGLKPTIRKESKNGITYNVEEITESDLRNIAEAKFNDLKNTPQGRLMYKRFLDVAGDEDSARNMFNDSVIDANRWRIYHKDDYDDNYFKHENLKLQQAGLDLEKEKLNISKERLNILRQKHEAEDKSKESAPGWTTRQKVAIMTNYKQNSESVYKNGANPSSIYGLLQTIPQGADKTTALALAAGVSDPEQISVGINSKRLPLMFGSNDLSVTKTRQFDYYDSVGGDLKPNRLGMTPQNRFEEKVHRTIARSFNNYLKENHVSGYIPSTDVTINYTSNNNDDVFDVNTYMRVKKDDIFGFFDNDQTKFISQGSSLGLVAVMKNGRTVNISGKRKGLLDWSNVEYVDIPVTRTISSTAYGNSVLDTYHDAKTLGKNTAAKRETMRADDDLENFEY